MSKEIVSIVEDSDFSRHVWQLSSENQSAIQLARRFGKLKSMKGKVFIEDKSNPSTIKVNCPVCDKREGTVYDSD